MPVIQNLANIQSFHPTGVGQTIAAVIFYAMALIVTVLGFSTIFVLLRNGRSRALSFVIALIYLFFYVTLMIQGIGIINSI